MEREGASKSVDPATGEVIDAEVVNDSHGALELAGSYRPALAMSPEQASDIAQKVDEMTRAIMREDVDFGVIPGTPKPTLYKPGAERLLQWFGLGHHFESPEIIRDESGAIFGAIYRCVVTRPLADRDVTVSTCDGYAGRDEGKWKKAPTNTLLKMAQKRALVGATLTATGTSGLFTQDVEDLSEPTPRRAPEPPQTISPAEVARLNDRLDRIPGDKANAILDLLGKAGDTIETLTPDKAAKVDAWIDKAEAG